MIVDLHTKHTLNGKSRDGILELLGEPDKKRTGETEIWLYQIEVGGEKPIRYFPVSFDRNGRASSGMAKGGTFSLVRDDG